jgi:putative hydrolase of the HAD superfamily
MYKNFIFDFGQVIVKFEPEYMTSAYVKNAEDVKLVKEVVFDRIYWDKLDAGIITDEEVKSGIRIRLPERLKDVACTVYDNWYYNIPVIHKTVDLIKKIKEKGGKLFLISNISKGFAQNYTKVPEIKEIFDLFDGLVFSGPIELAKPDKRIFNYALEKFGIKAEESIFFDDNKDNISGSDSVGIKGYLFSCDSIPDINNLIDNSL